MLRVATEISIVSLLNDEFSYFRLNWGGEYTNLELVHDKCDIHSTSVFSKIYIDENARVMKICYLSIYRVEENYGVSMQYSILHPCPWLFWMMEYTSIEGWTVIWLNGVNVFRAICWKVSMFSVVRPSVNLLISRSSVFNITHSSKFLTIFPIWNNDKGFNIEYVHFISYATFVEDKYIAYYN